MRLDRLSPSRLQELYLEYKNDFITVEAFADYHHIVTAQASLIIMSGKAIHETFCEFVKEFNNNS